MFLWALWGCGRTSADAGCPEGALDALRSDMDQVVAASEERHLWQGGFGPVVDVPEVDLPFVRSDAFGRVAVGERGEVEPALEPSPIFCDRMREGVELVGGVRLEAHRRASRARVEEVLARVASCGVPTIDVVFARPSGPRVAVVPTPAGLEPFEEAMRTPIDRDGPLPDWDAQSAPLDRALEGCPIDYDPVSRASVEAKERVYADAVVSGVEACGCQADMDLFRWQARMMLLPSRWLTVVPIDPADPPAAVLVRWPQD